MSDSLDWLRRVIEERTKGPWKTYSGDWRVLNFENYPICGTSNVLGHDESNARFIATMGTNADLIWAVIEAADFYVNGNYNVGLFNPIDRVKEALAALKAAKPEEGTDVKG
jgi:hypothetical protein